MNIREICVPYSCILCRDKDATYAIDTVRGYAIACCLDCLIGLTVSLSTYVRNMFIDNS